MKLFILKSLASFQERIDYLKCMCKNLHEDASNLHSDLEFEIARNKQKSQDLYNDRLNLEEIKQNTEDVLDVLLKLDTKLDPEE